MLPAVPQADLEAWKDLWEAAAVAAAQASQEQPGSAPSPAVVFCAQALTVVAGLLADVAAGLAACEQLQVRVTLHCSRVLTSTHLPTHHAPPTAPHAMHTVTDAAG